MLDIHAKETWKAVLGDLQVQINRPAYDTWLKDTEGISIAGNLYSVGVATSFASEWLERRMYQLIQKTVQRVTGRSLEVEFQVIGAGSGEKEEGVPGAEHPQAAGHFFRQTPIKLNGNYTFESFIVGPSNHLPYSVAQTVAESPGLSYNPLFIHSGVGLGKTHLLHAIGNSYLSQGINFIYATCEQFTNEFLAAIRSRTTEQFRDKYRNVDGLLIDDIQFLSGKEQTQEGFFHTFNALHLSNCQVVLASDRPPSALGALEDRLRSRFEWGLITDIRPPNLATRMAILRTKGARMDLSIDDTVVEFVAKKVQRNVRELEGSLNQIRALARLTDSPVTLELASQAIAGFVNDPSRRSVDPETIMDEVTRRFNVSNYDITGQSRKKHIARARHVAMFLLNGEIGMNHTEIGRLLGSRNHSTVVSALSRVNEQIKVDPDLRQDILGIKDAIFAL